MNKHYSPADIVAESYQTTGNFRKSVIVLGDGDTADSLTNGIRLYSGPLKITYTLYGSTGRGEVYKPLA